MRKTALWGFFLVASCSGSGGLSRSNVEDIAPGDALGTGASGEYLVDTLVLDCAGKCSGLVNGFPFSVCEIGNRESELIGILQNDGALRVDAEGNGFPSRFSGGLYADGRFEIGGVGSQFGVEILAFAEGNLSLGGELRGEMELQSQGSFEGSRIDCQALIELEGSKL